MSKIRVFWEKLKLIVMVGAMFFIIGAVVTSVLETYIDAKENYDLTEAIIISTRFEQGNDDVDPYYAYKYTYTYKGVEHKTTFTTSSDAGYREGSRFQIYVNPKNPEKVVFYDSSKESLSRDTIVVMDKYVFPGIYIIVVLYILFNDMQPEPPKQTL